MARLGRRKAVDGSAAEKYRRVGAALLESAETLTTLAEVDDQFGNAIAIVAIHGAIAYSDTLAIAFGGFKSTDGDHTRAADLVQEAMGSRAAERALKALRSALSMKDKVSYSGMYYRIDEAERLLEQVRRFSSWADEAYDHRR
ncbi:MAG TPA: hypothetical protein VFR81_05605 [Longimicrobium sp.]|nr:hypothetical protein [Longimicrobium sp.]